jgi:hypothetical protein
MQSSFRYNPLLTRMAQLQQFHGIWMYVMGRTLGCHGWAKSICFGMVQRSRWHGFGHWIPRVNFTNLTLDS